MLSFCYLIKKEYLCRLNKDYSYYSSYSSYSVYSIYSIYSTYSTYSSYINFDYEKNTDYSLSPALIGSLCRRGYVDIV